MDFETLVAERRSIRGYKPDPVSKEVIQEIIEIAKGAPSSMNTQPWHLFVVTGEPLDKNIYSLGPEELASIPTLPHSLDQALEALEEDHEFLLKGDVFTQDLIDTWIEFKRENEVDPLRLRPHPMEFEMYYDC